MINSNIKKDVISFEIKGGTIVFMHEAIASSGKSKKYQAKRSTSEMMKAFREASKAKGDTNASWLAIRALFSNDLASELKLDSKAKSEKLCRNTCYDSLAKNTIKACELIAKGKELSLVSKLEPKYNVQQKRLNVKSKAVKKHVKKTVKTAKLAEPVLA